MTTENTVSTFRCGNEKSNTRSLWLAGFRESTLSSPQPLTANKEVQTQGLQLKLSGRVLVLHGVGYP